MMMLNLVLYHVLSFYVVESPCDSINCTWLDKGRDLFLKQKHPEADSAILKNGKRTRMMAIRGTLWLQTTMAALYL